MMNYLKEFPLRSTSAIKLYSKDDFDGMRYACQLTARCLDQIASMIKPGLPTSEIDEFVYQFGKDNGAVPATLNYRGYPYSSCISINHVVCHGFPSSKPLRNGDILNVDITFILDGWHGDSSRMYIVGNCKRAAQRLIDLTYDCLMAGIAQVKPGIRMGAIGAVIQELAEKERCSVVRDFCGHGLGKLFHDSPNVLHYGTSQDGIEMRSGMIFTIEPMINLGRHHVKILKDGWTSVTRDHSLSAQFEHSIGVTDDGCEIFTQSPSGHLKPPYPNF
ncbi:type I methionyl aminopeptidase [Candidatus Endowatersipora endosymbiont of Watersipora subatra]|uniref:type I methionyl aminopeptidase n=1 Tax=Candidatus Endowatersipora endosymbiont of Watersipora subatra TaxID=3077946 RepID=UPI00312C8254